MALETNILALKHTWTFFYRVHVWLCWSFGINSRRELSYIPVKTNLNTYLMGASMQSFLLMTCLLCRASKKWDKGINLRNDQKDEWVIKKEHPKQGHSCFVEYVFLYCWHFKVSLYLVILYKTSKFVPLLQPAKQNILA